ncbi:SWIM zinc finger family protein [Streptomyces sp. NPDC004065]|uniref:SWIM zinc finger family protein n=1 Tax=Streptomyces sp. NPDC004065 TaxID=3364689 RepID=UPI0038514459
MSRSGAGGACRPGGPRPADAAREALRRAAAARRAGRGPDTAAGAEAEDPPHRTPHPPRVPRPPHAPSSPEVPEPSERTPDDLTPPTSRRPDTGPAAAAREALRAGLARREARAEQARTGAVPAQGPAASTDPRSGIRTAGPDAAAAPDPAVPDPAVPNPGALAGATPARAVRELLAGAFRMPATASDPRQEADDQEADDQEADDQEADDNGNGDGHPRHTGSAFPDDPPTRDATTAGPTAARRGPAPDVPVAARPGGPAPASAPASQQEPPATPPAPTPRMPRTMAAPRRDGELRRTFPAFPARSPGASGFAETWWGDAWVTALEEGALDAARLARGRGYAEQGNVDAITVTPGLVLAYVRGSRPRPYRVQVRLRTLDDADWDRFLRAAADRPGHIAALLDKEMPHSLADCGVPLLPGPGDLEPHCSCPDRGHPCKHAAALCYQTARLLDADPFVLLLLRGRGERELLDALSRLSATRAARAAQDREPEPLPGLRVTDVLAPRPLPPPPAPLPPPPHPEQPPVYPAGPDGLDPFALDQLATDAAARAHALLTTGRDPVGGLTLWQDAVRLAAARPGSGLTAATRALYASLASATGRSTAELARAVAAWRQGGAEGLAVLEEPWDPPAGRFDRARPQLLAADLPAFRPHRNRLTHPRGHLQLRLGRDGLWYAYESEPGRDDWWPRGTPDLDPVGALTGLGAPGDL